MVLTIVRTHSAGLQATGLPFFSPPSSGDCAGPSDSLGAFSLPARRLPGPREAYDLSSTQSFGSGPYTVTIKSTIRARRPAGSAPGGPGTTSSSSSSGSFPPPKEQKGLVESVSMQYRITGISGTVTTTFAGRPDPFCAPLDACGASGVVTDAISGTENRFEFDAQRVVKRRVSRRGALGDLRSGRLMLLDTGVLVGDRLSANVGWPVGSACTDRAQAAQRPGRRRARTTTSRERVVRPRHASRGSVSHRLSRACSGGRDRVFGDTRSGGYAGK